MEKAKSQVATIKDLERKLKRQTDDCRDLSTLYTSRYHRLQGRYYTCSIYLLVAAPIVVIQRRPERSFRGGGCDCKLGPSQGDEHLEDTIGR